MDDKNISSEAKVEIDYKLDAGTSIIIPCTDDTSRI